MGDVYRIVMVFDHKSLRMFRRDAAFKSPRLPEDSSARQDEIIAQSDISTRAKGIARRLEAETFSELADRTEEDVLGSPNCGLATFREISDHLKKRGLRLSEETPMTEAARRDRWERRQA